MTEIGQERTDIINASEREQTRLLGEKEAVIDDKFRLFIPSSIKKELKEDLCFTMMPGDPSIIVREQSVFDAMVLTLGPEENILCTTNTKYEKLRPNGRITIPEQFREKVKLWKNGKATIIGHGDSFQIWNPDLYREHREKLLSIVIEALSRSE